RIRRPKVRASAPEGAPRSRIAMVRRYYNRGAFPTVYLLRLELALGEGVVRDGLVHLPGLAGERGREVLRVIDHLERAGRADARLVAVTAGVAAAGLRLHE